jgi:hypothetical protein
MDDGIVEGSIGPSHAEPPLEPPLAIFSVPPSNAGDGHEAVSHALP